MKLKLEGIMTQFQIPTRESNGFVSFVIGEADDDTLTELFNSMNGNKLFLTVSDEPPEPFRYEQDPQEDLLTNPDPDFLKKVQLVDGEVREPFEELQYSAPVEERKEFNEVALSDGKGGIWRIFKW